MKHLAENSSAWTVIELAFDELHRRPSLELAVAEPLESEPAVRAHADRFDHAMHEGADGARIFQSAALTSVQVACGERAQGAAPRGAVARVAVTPE